MVDALPLLMFVALGVLLFSGYPVAFVLGGVALLFGLLGIAFDAFTFIQFFNIVPRIWGGIAESLILTAIPMFVFMGTMLERSGIAANLLRCLEVLLRRVPGGLALAVTLLGTILAASTGIIGASVVMMSVLALPVMLAGRYDTALSAGTIAASGTLGILIPPSIMLVIMAELLARSVGNLFFAALLPGLLLSALYVGYILVRCALAPGLAPPLPADAGPSTAAGLLRMAAMGVVPPVVLIVLVLGSILVGWASPTEASAVGAFGAAALAWALGRPRGSFLPALREVVQRTAETCGMLFMIFIGATSFSLVFRALGGDDVVLGLVESSALGPWGILIALMALVFVLGFFFDWVEITLIVLPVFAPIVEGLDFGSHVAHHEQIYWFAILMAVNLQTSFLTPPFGFALFYLKGVAPPEVRIQQVYRGIVPFVVLQLAGLGLVMAFPGIALWLPRTFLN